MREMGGHTSHVAPVADEASVGHVTRFPNGLEPEFARLVLHALRHLAFIQGIDAHVNTPIHRANSHGEASAAATTSHLP